MGLNEILILLVHDESPVLNWLQAAKACPLPWEQNRKYGCGVPDRFRTVPLFSLREKQEEIHDNIREPSADDLINTWIALACVVLWQNEMQLHCVCQLRQGADDDKIDQLQTYNDSNRR